MDHKKLLLSPVMMNSDDDEDNNYYFQVEEEEAVVELYSLSPAERLPAELLDKIISSLADDKTELLKCKLVCRMWNATATHLLLKQKLHMTLHYSATKAWAKIDSLNKYVQSPDGRYLFLDELNDILDSNFNPPLPQFPVTRFLFKGLTRRFLSPDIQRFFSNHGRNITHLNLDFGGFSHCSEPEGNVGPSFLGKILAIQATNLVHLELILPLHWNNVQLPSGNSKILFPQEIFNGNGQGTSTKTNNVNSNNNNSPCSSSSYASTSYATNKKKRSNIFPIIPNLKFLRMDLNEYYRGYDLILREILGAAVNLEYYNNFNDWGASPHYFNLEYCQTFASTKKLKVFSKFDFKPTPTNIQCLQAFCNVDNPSHRLKELLIDLRGVRMSSSVSSAVESVSNLLISSAPSLRVINLIHHSSVTRLFDSTLSFPECKEFTLSQIRSGELLFAGNESHFLSVFPSLLSLHLEIWYPKDEYVPWSIFFSKEFQPVSTVKEFSVRTNILTAPWICNIFRTFLNLQILELAVVKDIPVLVPEIWRMGIKLKILKLKLRILNNRVYSPVLDSIFTGFPTAACIKMRGMTEESLAAIKNKIIPFPWAPRQNYCLLHLKSLKELHITFSGEKFFTGPNIYDVPLISNVTRKFAFDLMPKLMINLTAEDINFKGIQESLIPFSRAARRSI